MVRSSFRRERIERTTPFLRLARYFIRSPHENSHLFLATPTQQAAEKMKAYYSADGGDSMEAEAKKKAAMKAAHNSDKDLPDRIPEDGYSLFFSSSLFVAFT